MPKRVGSASDPRSSSGRERGGDPRHRGRVIVDRLDGEAVGEGVAEQNHLPDGPGPAIHKRARDSEALAPSATGGWLVRRAGWVERALCLLAALLLLYLESVAIAAGAALLAAAVVIHLVTSRTPVTTERIDGEPAI